jgi:hypothetical protein
MSLITCTPGGTTDNCYITLSDANLYFGSTLRNAPWVQHPDGDRERALVQATQRIEQLGGTPPDPDSPERPLFDGSPYAPDVQVLHFPRTQDKNDAGSLIIPHSLRDAVCEQALWLLEGFANADLVDRQRLRDQGVKSISMDGFAETYGATSTPAGMCPAAWILVRPYLRRARSTVVR